MALSLREQGYEAYAIEGGLHAWRAEGHAVEQKAGRPGWLDALLSVPPDR